MERGVDAWYQRRLVHVLVRDDVAEVTVASVDVCTHSLSAVAGMISLQSHVKRYKLISNLPPFRMKKISPVHCPCVLNNSKIHPYRDDIQEMSLYLQASMVNCKKVYEYDNDR